MAVSEINKRLRGIHGTAWVCYCPRCRDVHSCYMKYIGRQRVPWVYCQTCKKAMEDHPVDYPEAHTVSVSIDA